MTDDDSFFEDMIDEMCEVEEFDGDDLPESQQALKEDLQDHDAPEWMIEKLEEGFYHDYASPAAAPKHLLCEDLQLVGITQLLDDVKQGEYDP